MQSILDHDAAYMGSTDMKKPITTSEYPSSWLFGALLTGVKYLVYLEGSLAAR